MKHRLLPLALSCGLALLSPTPAQAAMVTFYANDVLGNVVSRQQALSMTTSGNYDSNLGQIFPTAADFTVTIDEATPTLTYNRISVDVPSFTRSSTVLFTTGLGQTTAVTTNITYNAFTILYAATEALVLTAATGGDFLIALPTLQAFGAVAMSGQYSVAGPTQTATGSFSSASFPAVGSPGTFRWAKFNSLGYPNTSQLTSPETRNTTNWNLTDSIFDVTVDGFHMTANLGTLRLNSGFGDVPLAVPEPASAVLLGLGVLGLAARRRKG